MMLRIIRWTAYGLIAALVAASAVLWLGQGGMGKLASTATGVSVPGGVSVGGPFQLIDDAGRAVTEASYRGRFMLIYFGYTTCPDVCPTELQTMAAALDRLGPEAARIAPLFITVDPERDTVAVLAGYVKLFDERLVGLTGPPAQIAAAARAFRVYYAKATSKDSTTYLMDHSSFLYLMGPDGTFRALFRQGMTPKDLADALHAAVAAS